MLLAVAENRDKMGKYSARKAAECLKAAIATKGEARLIVATGSSQFEVLSHLVAEPGIDWSNVDGFHLDEYIGVAMDHPASFCGYLKQRFVDRVPLRSFHFLDGTQDAMTVVKNASEKIASHKIDLAMVGIGENSHLAFNDPPANFETEAPYIIVELDEACRMQQVGEGWFPNLDAVPKQAISMSIRQILKTEKIICSVPDERKAVAVRNSIQGHVTPQVPASILQRHADVELVIDRAASKLLNDATLSKAKSV
jgi:glucosamine-6-phosphate deaminase